MFTPKVSGLKFLLQVNKHTKIQFLEKIKWNLKIYPLGIMKTLLLYHLKQTSWQFDNKCINEEVLGLQSSLLR